MFFPHPSFLTSTSRSFCFCCSDCFTLPVYTASTSIARKCFTDMPQGHYFLTVTSQTNTVQYLKRIKMQNRARETERKRMGMKKIEGTERVLSLRTVCTDDQLFVFAVLILSNIQITCESLWKQRFILFSFPLVTHSGLFCICTDKESNSVLTLHVKILPVFVFWCSIDLSKLNWCILFIY